MNQFTFLDNLLMCEGVALRDIAERFGTPLYVYSGAAIHERCREIESAFEGRGHVTCYAVKANANRTLLRLIAQEGFGADVGSRGELHLALEAGFQPDRITFSGVGKRDDEIAYALEKEIQAFNVESAQEIEVISGIAGGMAKRGRILLRVNLDIDAGGHAYVSTSKKQNKFGVPRDKAQEVLRWASGLANIDVRGVHSHIGSQILKAETFQEAARSLAGLVKELRQSGLAIPDLDFGGGYGVQYRGFISHPMLPEESPERDVLAPAAMIRTVLPILETTGCRLSIQPGRSVVAQAGTVLVRVLYRKETEEKTFIIVDGGMNDLIRPSLYHAYHQIVPLTLNEAPRERVDVVGPVCETGDFFALDRPLPRTDRNDLLAIMGAGAYGFVLSSNYNARLRPAEVLVEGTSCRVIRERESIEQL